MSPHRRFLALEHEVSLILAETSAAAEAYPKLLATVGTSLGWDFGPSGRKLGLPAAAEDHRRVLAVLAFLRA